MAISTYAELQAAIASWTDRTDLTTLAPDFIALFEARANRLLRARNQQSQSTASVSTQLSSLPTDFREVITVQLRSDGSDPYTHLGPAPSDVIASYVEGDDTTARPRFWGLIGDQLLLYPEPDQSYTVLLTYYQQVPALSVSNTSNWLLEQGPDIYLDGALGSYHEWDRNMAEADRYYAKAQAGLIEVMSQRRQSAATLRTEVARMLPRRSYNIYRDL